MTADQIKAVVDNVPFRPFKVRIVDGRSIPVLRRESVMFHAVDNTLFIASDAGGLHILGGCHIDAIEPLGETTA